MVIYCIHGEMSWCLTTCQIFHELHDANVALFLKITVKSPKSVASPVVAISI